MCLRKRGSVLAMAAFLFSALASLGSGLPLQEKAVIELPKPTGQFPVGTTVWHWVDGSRLNPLTPQESDVREIMVQVWYPARGEPDAPQAAYAPLYGGFGHVKTNSVADSPFAKLEKPAPVIVICPGRGVARHSYSAIAEELASHGYVTVGLDSAGIGLVVYPDGRVVLPSSRFRPSAELMGGPYEKVDEFFAEAAELGKRDVLFALRKLSELAKNDPTGRFTGRLDLKRIGIFGHSLGGRVAGAAAGSDPRVRAYAAMEGIPPREVRRGRMGAAVAFLISSPVPEKVLANYKEVLPNQRNDVFLFLLGGFGHNSVTDQPLIEPARFPYGVQPGEGLRVTRLIILNFFEKYLRNLPVDLQALENEQGVRVEAYPRSK